MNLRQCISRNLTYSLVTVTYTDEEIKYLVYGETTEKKELKKVLKESDREEVPTVKVVTTTEKRAITIEKFIENSILINNEGEI